MAASEPTAPLAGTAPGLDPRSGIASGTASTVAAEPAAVSPLGPGPGGTEVWVYDCEVFSNWFLCLMTDGRSWRRFDSESIPELVAVIQNRSLTLAGFNSSGYDDRILLSLVQDPGSSTAAIHQRSQRIIAGDDGPLRTPSLPAELPWGCSIDVLQLLNGRGSLKEWSCRMGFPMVADSPADFLKPCPPGLMAGVEAYCRTDVENTQRLLQAHWPLVELRTRLAARFDLDRRIYALTEPRLAQHTLLELHQRRTGMTPGAARAAALANPDNALQSLPLDRLISGRVSFATEPFQQLLGLVRRGTAVGDAEGRTWSIALPDGSSLDAVALAGTTVALGIGGLHSIDVPGIHQATDEVALIDLDVTSYYPAIIITEGLYPRHLGPGFVEDLALLREERLAAKRAGDKATADALKIVLNSTYGKLNDRWSPLRSVPDALRVSITGQWFLLMLIEQLDAIGASILSANTDGVTIKLASAGMPALQRVIAHWQERTGMALERTDFARLCRRDVNSYVARTVNGKVRTKGAFNAESGKGDGLVIKRAATAYLLDGIDPQATVAAEQDPAAFLFYQRAKNGGELFHGETAMPPTVRWYASRGGEPMRRQNPNGSWAILPHGQGTTLALDISGWRRPSLVALDLGHYVDEAWRLIHDVEPQRPLHVQQSIFDII